MKTHLGERGGRWGVIGKGHLKVGGVHKLFLIKGRALIVVRRLKEGGRLLEDSP